MKKKAHCFVVLVMCIGFVVQLLQGAQPSSQQAEIRKTVVQQILESIATAIRSLVSVMYKIEEDYEAVGDKVNFSEKIEKTIDLIINITYESSDKILYKVFPTLRSQIFLLQNIEDFFEFKQGKEFSNFKLLVYQICIKKINELERQLISQEDAEGNVRFVDRDQVAKAIDDVRDWYMNKLGISSVTLKTIAALNPDEKDKQISKKITGVWDFILQVFDDVSAQTISDFDGKSRNIALYSILGYLYYIRDAGKNAFIGTQTVTQEDITPQLAVEEITDKPTLYTIPEKPVNLTGLKLMSLAAAMRARGKNPEEKQYTQQVFEQKQREYQVAAQRLEKPSLFSRLRSAFNSWWYGSK